jgi:hypothetical protein
LTDWLILAGITVLLGRAYGWKITMLNDKDKIVYHPPPPGAPPMAGHFEVPLNSEGEKFLQGVMHDLPKKTEDKENNVKESSSYL